MKQTLTCRAAEECFFCSGAALLGYFSLASGINMQKSMHAVFSKQAKNSSASLFSAKGLRRRRGRGEAAGRFGGRGFDRK